MKLDLQALVVSTTCMSGWVYKASTCADTFVIYGSASMMIRKRKVPVVWMPTRNCTSMDAPGASGVPVEIVPAAIVEL